MRKQMIVLLILSFVSAGCVSTRSAQKDNSAPAMAKIVMGRPSCH